MEKLLKVGLLFSLVSLIFAGCGDDEVTAPDTTASTAEIYVINVLGNTISTINLETSTVTNDVAVTGTFPNSLVYRNGNLYLINSGSNDIRIFDVMTWQEEAPIDVGAGNNPMNMVFFDDNTAYVSALLTNSVLKINMVTKAVDAVIEAGIGTTGLALASGKIYATNTAFDGATFTYGPGTVTVIDGASGSVISTISVAMNPQSAAVAPDGMVHVLCTGNFFSVFGRVYVIDPATDTVVDSILVQGSPGVIGISGLDNLGYLADWGKGALVYNTETYLVVNDTANYFLGAGGSGILVGIEGNVFISDWDGNRVVMLDKNGTILNDFSVGDSPGALALRTELE